MAVTIGGVDMHKMVKQLQEDKKGHESGIANLSLRELREKVSSSAMVRHCSLHSSTEP